jgi:HPt (histidine-containing phosphotransfer) domain-containing protein
MLRRFGGDDALLADVLAEFSRGLPELGAGVGDAIAARDAPALIVAAHRLRGALLEIGAFPAADLARQLEMSGGQQDVQRRVELWSGLSPLLAALAADLAWTLAP